MKLILYILSSFTWKFRSEYTQPFSEGIASYTENNEDIMCGLKAIYLMCNIEEANRDECFTQAFVLAELPRHLNLPVFFQRLDSPLGA
jgi:hypothetical protein